MAGPTRLELATSGVTGQRKVRTRTSVANARQRNERFSGVTVVPLWPRLVTIHGQNTDSDREASVQGQLFSPIELAISEIGPLPGILIVAEHCPSYVRGVANGRAVRLSTRGDSGA